MANILCEVVTVVCQLMPITLLLLIRKVWVQSSYGRALKDAGMKPEDIDYVNVEPQPVGDPSEAKYIKVWWHADKY